jgi:hypothetical protein
MNMLSAIDRAGRHGQRLVDGLDAGMARIERRVEPHLLALEADLAFIRVDAPETRLDQRRLAGAVVADDGKDFTRGGGRSRNCRSRSRGHSV